MSTIEIFGLIGAGILSLLGIGVLVYAIRSLVMKFKAEYKETGFHPPYYYYFIGLLYGLPLGVIVLLIALPHQESFGKWSFIIAWLTFIPYYVISLLLTKKNAAKLRPQTDEEKRKERRYNPCFIILVILFVAYKAFIQKG